MAYRVSTLIILLQKNNGKWFNVSLPRAWARALHLSEFLREAVRLKAGHHYSHTDTNDDNNLGYPPTQLVYYSHISISYTLLHHTSITSQSFLFASARSTQTRDRHLRHLHTPHSFVTRSFHTTSLAIATATSNISPTELSTPTTTYLF